MGPDFWRPECCRLLRFVRRALRPDGCRNGVIRGAHKGAAGGSPSGLPVAHDLQGDWLLPGLVELHTDNLERHVTPRPRVTFPMQRKRPGKR